MKRDFDLIRKILLDVQREPAGSLTRGLDYEPEYDAATVGSHVDMLIKANLIEGTVLKSMNVAVAGFFIIGLTWDGHNFIDAAAKDTLWKKAFSVVQDKGGAMTFEVLKGLLMKLALQQVSL